MISQFGPALNRVEKRLIYPYSSKKPLFQSQNQFFSGADVELFVNMVDMGLEGAEFDKGFSTDFLVAFALENKTDHLVFLAG